MVGHRPLEASIGVRVPAPQPIFTPKNRVETSMLSTHDKSTLVDVLYIYSDSSVIKKDALLGKASRWETYRSIHH